MAFLMDPTMQEFKLKHLLLKLLEGSTTVRWQNAFPVMNGFILGA